MEAHVAAAFPRPRFPDGQCSHADGRNTSLVDDGRESENVFGTSVAWQDVLKRATRVAATEATTCLEGAASRSPSLRPCSLITNASYRSHSRIL